MGRKSLILDVYDELSKKYVAKNTTLTEIANKHGVCRKTIENAYYHDKLINQRYKLIHVGNGNKETKEERIIKKIEDEEEFRLLFRIEWDRARFKLNSKARRYLDGKET